MNWPFLKALNCTVLVTNGLYVGFLDMASRYFTIAGEFRRYHGPDANPSLLALQGVPGASGG